MKIAVRYQSRGGNTKAVAEAMAKAAGVKAETIDTPLVEVVDLLFIGGGVYKWDIDPALARFVENLNPALVKSAAAFTTAGGMDKTGKIVSALKSRGIHTEEGTLPVKVGIRNHAWLGGKGFIQLTEKQIQSIDDFVKSLMSKKS